MASILVIGVGSTGLSVMEHAQQFYYEFTKHNSSDNNAAFMFLETDGNRTPQVTPNGKTDIQSCYLTPNNVNATLTNWHQTGKYNWLPTTAQVLNTHSGAAGQPAFGRVALWEQETAVRNMITALYAKINGNRNTNIYIVGSLTGGTGTGIFIDVAYMVRQCTNNNNIYGMFLLPNRQDVGQQTKDMIYQNAYSSLKTLDKFSKVDTKKNKNFECVLPGGTNISSLSAPFYNVQFLTEDFNGATASLNGLPQLVQSAGFNLVLRMLDVTNTNAPFQDLINSRLVDYTSHVPDGIFTTIGLNVFQYPETLLEEYLTTKLLEENLLKRWADTTNYIDKNGTSYAIDTLKARLRVEATHFIQEAIDKAIEKSQGSQMLGKTTFRAALAEEINTIRSGNYKAPSEEHYIFSLFDANSTAPKFYAAILGQATNLRDELIRSIANKIQDISTEYQNLAIVQMWINNITETLRKLTDDWLRRYHIDGSPTQWNKCWNNQFDERLAHGKWFYTSLGCQQQWYEEALGGVAKLCYYNIFIPMIANVINSMQNINGAQTITTAAGELLPTIDMWRAISAKVTQLLNPQDNLSLIARKNDIHGQLQGNCNSQINLLFQGNTCDDDVRAAEGKYLSKSERLTFATITQDNLWNFLYSNNIIILKSTLISNGLDFIQHQNLFANTDIVQIMMHLQPSHYLYPKVNNILNGMPELIKQDTPAMAHLINTEQFEPHNCLKLIVASPLDSNNASGIVSHMQNFTASDSNFAQLPSMKNTVVIYQEYGYLGSVSGVNKTFNPLIHLSYQPQVLEALKEKNKNQAYDDSVRLAYIDKETLIDINHINIQ